MVIGTCSLASAAAPSLTSLPWHDKSRSLRRCERRVGFTNGIPLQISMACENPKPTSISRASAGLEEIGVGSSCGPGMTGTWSSFGAKDPEMRLVQPWIVDGGRKLDAHHSDPMPMLDQSQLLRVQTLILEMGTRSEQACDGFLFS